METFSPENVLGSCSLTSEQLSTHAQHSILRGTVLRLYGLRFSSRVSEFQQASAALLGVSNHNCMAWCGNGIAWASAWSKRIFRRIMGTWIGNDGHGRIVSFVREHWNGAWAG